MRPFDLDDYSLIVETSLALQASAKEETREWDGSPFRWIRSKNPGRVGSIGVSIVSAWARSKGCAVEACPDSEADIVVDGCRAEVKFSTLWGSGIYRFQQLRDQEYDFAICLGVSPHNAHCWVIPKEDLMRLWRVEGVIRGQHGGDIEDANTAWIVVDPALPPEWIRPYGGSLDEAAKSLERHVCR